MRLDADPLLAPLDLSSRRSLLVAVSGGSDSTALLLLAKRFADRRDIRLHAATVDHGLRQDSGREAGAVSDLCARLGIAHATLSWTGDKPATGIQAAARLARHRLLAHHAESIGTDVVLVGHTRQDQAETIAMRRLRGDAGHPRRGDAGIAGSTLHDGRIWFVRPLLSAYRGDLRAMLEADGIAYVDDPSNADPRFERARMRASFPDAIADPAARIADNEAAARLIEAFVCTPARGLFRIDVALLGADGAATAMRMVLAVAGGLDHLADAGRTARLVERLSRGPVRTSLARTVVERRANFVFLHREARDLPSAARAHCDDLWDGRRIVAEQSGVHDRIAPIGAASSDLADVLPVGAARRLVAAAAAAEPGIWRGQTFVGPAPCRPVLAPWRLFLPDFDLAPAAALARVLDLPAPPTSPWRDQNRSLPSHLP